MNTIDDNPAALALPSASLPDLLTVNRLIVLVPESLADPIGAARKIWELANSLDSSVQLVGLCKDLVQEPSLRRQLVFLSLLVSDGFVSVESKVEYGNNWLKVVKSHWRRGDVIVCFDGQHAGLMHRPLERLIESSLRVNVYVLRGGDQMRQARPNWLSSVIAWGGSLGILTAFFWIQVQILEIPQSWAQNALMYLSIPLEAGLIWGWNTLFP